MKLINDWCSLHTNGMIPTFVDKVTYQVKLLNALYFNGTWQTKCNKDHTTRESFHSSTGNWAVDMMHNSFVTDYYADDNFEMLELPFDGENYSLRLLLPREGVDIAAATELLTYDYFRSILASEGPVHAIMSLPRLDLDQELQLNTILRTYGINVNAVSLPAIGSGGIGTLKIKQKTASRITKEGASVAAVTGNGIVLSPGEGYIPKEVTIDFNRPFIFVLSNNRTNTVLMAGRILRP